MDGSVTTVPSGVLSSRKWVEHYIGLAKCDTAAVLLLLEHTAGYGRSECSEAGSLAISARRLNKRLKNEK